MSQSFRKFPLRILPKSSLKWQRSSAASRSKKAKKLLKLTLDDGSGKERIVASGIAQYYSPDDLAGRNVIVVANLKPATLCGVESCGMILAADSGDGVKVILPTTLMSVLK